MKVTVNDTKARRKNDSGMELLRAFGPFGMLAQDALEFFKTSMLAQELNFDPVGIITAQLRRSYNEAGLYEREPNLIRLSPNLSVAPYAEEVSDRVQRRFGNSFTQLTIDRVKSEVDEAIMAEVKRAVAVIQAGGRYKYENPFPPVDYTPKATG